MMMVMSLYNEIRQLLESARNANDIGSFANITRGVAQPGDTIAVADDDLHKFILDFTGAQSDALLRIAKRVDKLSETIGIEHNGEEPPVDVTK